MSTEAEMSVIGCMLLDTECANKAVDRLAPDMFSSPALRKIFEAATDLYWDGKKIDPVTLMNKLPPYKDTLVKLAQYVPTWSHLDDYMRIVFDDWRRSTIENSLSEIILELKNRTASESIELLRELIKKQDGISQAQSDDGISFSEAVEQFIEWMKSNQELNTVKTGFRDLDSAIGGFLKSSVTALCARSGHGKTDFALNLALRMAKRGYKVQYFTMEMTALQLMQRVASKLSQIDGERVRDKNLSEEERGTINSILSAFEHEGKINFVENPKGQRMSIKTIRHHVDLFKPDAIFIDHIGLLERPNVHDSYRALGLVSNDLKQMALEKNISIIELVQMNRLVEGRKDKRPNLSDIRESGDIEQDADYAMFVQPDEDLTDKRIAGDAWADATVYLLKNRHGRPGTFHYHWQPQYHTFTEVDSQHG